MILPDDANPRGMEFSERTGRHFIGPGIATYGAREAARPPTDNVCFWHKADMLIALTNVHFLGQPRYNAARRFPPLWSVEELDARFVVTDSAGQKLAPWRLSLPSG
jgi:hypothetical protein